MRLIRLARIFFMGDEITTRAISRRAARQSKANDRYYGVPTKSPRLVVAIEAQLTRMLDLTILHGGGTGQQSAATGTRAEKLRPRSQ